VPQKEGRGKNACPTRKAGGERISGGDRVGPAGSPGVKSRTRKKKGKKNLVSRCHATDSKLSMDPVPWGKDKILREK